MLTHSLSFFFFFNDTATTEIYTLSLHDALPIYDIDITKPFGQRILNLKFKGQPLAMTQKLRVVTNNYRVNGGGDRKSTRLNSSHLVISYAVFCLKKKTNNCYTTPTRVHTSPDTT